MEKRDQLLKSIELVNYKVKAAKKEREKDGFGDCDTSLRGCCKFRSSENVTTSSDVEGQYSSDGQVEKIRSKGVTPSRKTSLQTKELQEPGNTSPKKRKRKFKTLLQHQRSKRTGFVRFGDNFEPVWTGIQSDQRGWGELFGNLSERGVETDL
ncbi:hypothetical protein AYI68_g7120 [Smittium mucronatum]|uniref:Uncharacterized protein n=1 Tax=Smittium mucronatum TaxID=133383 RepID=A0A1R0GPL3_9FUNG|nr:hypothetical protein AYI68_g7120 [Smittium mucronatum]